MSEAPPAKPSLAGKRNPWIVVATAALVVVGAGIWLAHPQQSATKSAPSALSGWRSTPGFTSISTPGTSIPGAFLPPGQFTAAESTLLGELPAGYDAASCVAKRPPTWGAVAKLECEQNSKPGGPTVSDFWLFGDDALLGRAFKQSVDAMTALTACAAAANPTSWPDGGAAASGQIACGSYRRNQDVTWTNNSKLLLADVQGPDLAAMYNWFGWFGQYANR
jgi:serine/threonine kinase PknH